MLLMLKHEGDHVQKHIRTSICGKQLMTLKNRDFDCFLENMCELRAAEKWYPLIQPSALHCPCSPSPCICGIIILGHLCIRSLIRKKDNDIAHWLITCFIRDSTLFRSVDRQNNLRVLPLRACDVLRISSLQSVSSLFISG
jgi:hypothetical protein